MMGRFVFEDRFVATVRYVVEAADGEQAYRIAETLDTYPETGVDFDGTEFEGELADDVEWDGPVYSDDGS